MTQGEVQRVLYVEDEPDIQVIAKIALENVGGFTVRVCSSGQEALACAVEFAPDLVLMDVMMPGMDGPATLSGLRELPELKHTPVIFMTAKVLPEEIAHFKSLGAIDVIAKPFDPMRLSDQVRTSWRKVYAD